MKQTFLVYSASRTITQPRQLPFTPEAINQPLLVDLNPVEIPSINTPIVPPERPPLTHRMIKNTVRGIGAGLIGFAILTLAVSYGPVVQKEITYQFKPSPIAPDRFGFGNLLEIAEAQRISNIQKEAASLGINSFFSIVIPKINAVSNIVANVDTSNENEYRQALMTGIAHAKGTAFPGQGKRIYLFSHSTDFDYNVARYNAVFYLLRKLENGDQVQVYFADHKYIYEVTDKKIVDANDTSWLNMDGNQEELILQTCDPPGTSWRRLIVTARLKRTE